MSLHPLPSIETRTKPTLSSEKLTDRTRTPKTAQPPNPRPSLILPSSARLLLTGLSRPSMSTLPINTSNSTDTWESLWAPAGPIHPNLGKLSIRHRYRSPGRRCFFFLFFSFVSLWPYIRFISVIEMEFGPWGGGGGGDFFYHQLIHLGPSLSLP